MRFAFTLGAVLVFELNVDRDGVDLAVLQPIEDLEPAILNVLNADDGETYVVDPEDEDID